MKSIAEDELTRNDLEMYDFVVKIVEAIPQLLPVEEFRCHEVARIVGSITGLPVFDGKYHGVDHSWLELKVRPWIIIDPYCVASWPKVRLVVLSNYSVKRHGYAEGQFRTDIQSNIVDHAAEIVRKSLGVQG